jgi:hypothetical protein
MHESPLTAWANFYVIIGSAAAALTGLTFVVSTLVAQRPPVDGDPGEGTKTFTSPTIVHFCAALLIAGIMSAPWHRFEIAEGLIGVAGVCGVAYVSHVLYRLSRMAHYDVDLDEWIWYGYLPLLAYAAIVASAAGAAFIASQALFALGGATLLLIFVGIHNAWDVVTYLAINAAQR